MAGKMSVPLTKCIAIPAHQLPPSIDPSIAAMSICRPIIGATMYIIAVITSVPTKPPNAARPKFACMTLFLHMQSECILERQHYSEATPGGNQGRYDEGRGRPRPGVSGSSAGARPGDATYDRRSARPSPLSGRPGHGVLDRGSRGADAGGLHDVRRLDRSVRRPSSGDHLALRHSSPQGAGAPADARARGTERLD